MQRQRSGQEHDCPEEVPPMRRGEVLLPGALQLGLGSAQASLQGHQVEGTFLIIMERAVERALEFVLFRFR
jgi:hypothetical protein